MKTVRFYRVSPELVLLGRVWLENGKPRGDKSLIDLMGDVTEETLEDAHNRYDGFRFKASRYMTLEEEENGY